MSSFELIQVLSLVKLVSKLITLKTVVYAIIYVKHIAHDGIVQNLKRCIFLKSLETEISDFLNNLRYIKELSQKWGDRVMEKERRWNEKARTLNFLPSLHQWLTARVQMADTFHFLAAVMIDLWWLPGALCCKDFKGCILTGQKKKCLNSACGMDLGGWDDSPCVVD